MKQKLNGLNEVKLNRFEVSMLVNKYTKLGIIREKIRITFNPAICLWSLTKKCVVGEPYTPTVSEGGENVPVSLSIYAKDSIDVDKINNSEGIIVSNATYGNDEHYRFAFIPSKEDPMNEVNKQDKPIIKTMETGDRENVFTLFARGINDLCNHKINKEHLYELFVSCIEICDENEKGERLKYRKDIDALIEKGNPFTAPYSNYFEGQKMLE